MAYNRAQLLNRIVQSMKWDDFLSFASFMWWEKRYSIFNSALIYLQRPGALYVDTEGSWSSNYNRHIKPGATPIVVVHPFGPVNFLYELSDTYGDKVPHVLRNRFQMPNLRPLNNENYLPHAKNLCKQLGIFCNESQLGTRLYGVAKYLDEPISYTITRSKNEILIKTRYAIVLNQNIPENSKVLTIFHEIGHILCGHLPYDEGNPLLNPPKRPDRQFLSVAQKECEAEKVCEMFSSILGYDYNPSDYLKDYIKDNPNIEYSLRYVAESVDHILKKWQAI